MATTVVAGHARGLPDPQFVRRVGTSRGHVSLVVCCVADAAMPRFFKAN